MSKKKSFQKPLAATSVSETASQVESPSISTDSSALAFGRSNYLFMLIGLGVIALGFIIMTLDKEEFGFGFLGITLGPLVVFAGFMIELYAILKKKS